MFAYILGQILLIRKRRFLATPSCRMVTERAPTAPIYLHLMPTIDVPSWNTHHRLTWAIFSFEWVGEIIPCWEAVTGTRSNLKWINIIYFHQNLRFLLNEVSGLSWRSIRTQLYLLEYAISTMGCRIIKRKDARSSMIVPYYDTCGKGLAIFT